MILAILVLLMPLAMLVISEILTILEIWEILVLLVSLAILVILELLTILVLLVLGTLPLEDANTVAQYGITSGAQLHLLFRLRGGMQRAYNFDDPDDYDFEDDDSLDNVGTSTPEVSGGKNRLHIV